ncbi:two-component sensor histidine kinase [Streptomyces sp. 110]|uniref:histidine kinase n=1 Tax=Streptomyces endocoffeicus TaxID=2898945 RepID=A0ABS1PS75_9ACTN|nr:histidine kinase [Streptomyces endocoffeicus]MBL1114551.1 two-component sensor histidine kinase [Streptomyces endocoffeicus]
MTVSPLPPPRSSSPGTPGASPAASPAPDPARSPAPASSAPSASSPPPAPAPRRRPPQRVMRWGSLIVPVLLAIADALLVNGVTFGLELNVSLAAAAALLVRRKLPALVFLVTLPGILIGYVWFAPMIALYTVARLRPDRRLLGISALLLAAAHFIPWPVSDFEPTAYRENTLTLIDACVTSVGPIALGLLVRTRGELAARIEDLTRSRRHADELIAEQVLSTERARLAREMHDVVAHQVSLISLQAGAVQISAEDAKAREGARTIRELSVRTLDELRHMVGILRAAGGDHEELTPQPRLADLPRLIELSALDVSFETDSATQRPGHSEAVERAAFRIVQEALTNVRKHAPGARVTVRVNDAQPEGPEAADGPGGDRGAVRKTAQEAAQEAAPGRTPGTAPRTAPRTAQAAEETRGLRVEVHNGPPDASAVAPGLPGGGHGLVGLRERAQLLGGTLEAGPTEEGGFVVRADFPKTPRVTGPA